jgi:hypothetical protein
MKTFLIGDITEYLSTEAKKLDTGATLITETNCNDIRDGVSYISLGDFTSLIQFVNTLDLADTIIYCPPQSWSDIDDKNYSYMQLWTEFYIVYFKNKKNVIYEKSLCPDNLDAMTRIIDSRAVDTKQIWSVGCSVTHGIGLKDQNQRYGQIISDVLELPVTFLSHPGSSIQWAADQILRSDIRSGDIVIWGLTNHVRFPFFTDGSLHHINAAYYETHPKFNNIVGIDRLADDNIVYSTITKILQVVNFCQKLNVNLLICGLLFDQSFFKCTSSLSNYIQLHGRFGVDPTSCYLDFGLDHKHPGPATHKWYADEILKEMKKLNWQTKL